MTLVEMLVIVAMLAVMLGVLLPALTAARTLAWQQACEEHLRTIGMAIHSYSRSGQGRLPKARFLPPPVIGGGSGPALTIALVGHMKAATDAFHCPGDQMYLYQYCGISYFYNFTMGGKPLQQAPRIVRGESPSNVPVLWDADNTVFPTSTGQLVVPRFHEQRAALFADWSVGDLDDDATPFF